eukprot:PhF_6_TR19175/c0_g1_i1/m.28199
MSFPFLTLMLKADQPPSHVDMAHIEVIQKHSDASTIPTNSLALMVKAHHTTSLPTLKTLFSLRPLLEPEPYKHIMTDHKENVSPSQEPKIMTSPIIHQTPSRPASSGGAQPPRGCYVPPRAPRTTTHNVVNTRCPSASSRFAQKLYDNTQTTTCSNRPHSVMGGRPHSAGGASSIARELRAVVSSARGTPTKSPTWQRSYT